MAGLLLFVLALALGLSVSPWFFLLAAVPIVVTVATR